jgi:hypothetical protein
MMVAVGLAPVAEAGPWRVAPDFENSDAAEQISGASCPGMAQSQDWCIAVNDEKKYVQFFRRDEQRIVPGERIRVMVKTDAVGVKHAEPDLEGVARDGGYVYVTGSHGAPRKGKPVQASRFHVFRLPVDAATGAPGFTVSRKALAPQIVSSTRLRPAIAALPELAAFAEKPLSENGVTIEGLGAMHGQLFFGLRTPVDRDGAFILQAPASELFDDGAVALTSHRVPLGEGYGIRAMERFREAFLLLAGTGFGKEKQPVVWLWAPGHPPLRVTALDVPKGWKAEGLMLLSDDAGQGVRVLVFFDGQKNGAPMEFRLPLK